MLATSAVFANEELLTCTLYEQMTVQLLVLQLLMQLSIRPWTSNRILFFFVNIFLRVRKVGKFVSWRGEKLLIHGD